MDLHIFFLPFLAPGHMIPMVDMARLFADRGVKATVVTTPANAAHIRPTIEFSSVKLLIIDFPSAEVGLPAGLENLIGLPTPLPTPAFDKALDLLEHPFRDLLRSQQPDCIISDTQYWWSSAVASEFGIPRLVFQGMGFFSLIVFGILAKLKPYEAVASEEELFAVPHIPHEVKLARSELPDFILSPEENIRKMAVAQGQSYGMVMNTFYELEAEAVEFLKVAWKMRVWIVGPVCLRNEDVLDKAVRGNTAAVAANEFLSWLDGKKPRSVLYVCFGSLGRFTAAQWREMALGLEASGQPFIWVVKNAGKPAEWLPEEFEERTRGRGLIINGWAPQVLILNHGAVGGFMSHCGWNSCLEGITSGVPMLTWPLFADQFINEKFLVEVLSIGVSIGFKKSTYEIEDRPLMSSDTIKNAIKELMDNGEKTIERRQRAKETAEKAKMAVEEGGSSYNDVSSLIEELISLKNKARENK